MTTTSALFDDLPETLPAALKRAAERFPQRGIALFDGRGRRHERRTFVELEAVVQQAAGRWRAAGVSAGDVVLVALPTTWAWFEAWLGAVEIGALPVAVAPAVGFGAADAQLDKLSSLVQRLEAKRVIASAPFLAAAKEAEHRALAAAGIAVDAWQKLAPVAGTQPAAQPQDIAFLQLTSGSTGHPRAVMIRHHGALHNACTIDEAVGAGQGGPAHTWADAIVGWLPLHHDMGLLGQLLLALLTGVDLWLFPPTAFLARPRLWLQELSRHGQCLAHGPNFAYQLCVERLDDGAREGLDLSRWRAAQSGAEMIRPETVHAFVERFAPVGFRPTAFQASYGLAEATLAVSVDRRGQGMRTRPLPKGSIDPALGDRGLVDGAFGDGALSDVVCLGQSVVDTEVRIVDAAGRAMGAERIGEVQVRGPGVFAGYHREPQASAECLVDGWLRTGDLGFLADDELYLTGRSKDLLIIRGHNVMPHELEWLAEKVGDSGGSHRCGAFSVVRSSQGEEAILVVESSTKDPDLRADVERQIRLEVSHALGLPIADLVFVRRGKIPKTTSGKVQRRQLKQQYLDGALERL